MNTSAAPAIAAKGSRLSRETLGAQALDYIRTRIYAGDFKAGQRIPQAQIAEDLGVSRVPVREALIALEEIGLVSSEVHRGVFVQPILREDIADHFRIYGSVQGHAAATAAERMTEPVMERLEALHQAMIDGRDGWSNNYEFHRLINLTGGSNRLRFILRTMSFNIAQDLFHVPEYADDVAIADHAAILDALRRNDTDELFSVNVRHVARDGIAVIAELERRGVLSD